MKDSNFIDKLVSEGKIHTAAWICKTRGELFNDPEYYNKAGEIFESIYKNLIESKNEEAIHYLEHAIECYINANNKEKAESLRLYRR
ncbi:MAG: hypothetical protein ARM1_0127 [Candidatus Micrarchaeota archaeon]|nr:MAG: hypothetical protein ARM1_0127 [Candidatus Micrarchaeota archaeon]